MGRAAVYARVSTTDRRGQDPKTQLRQLREPAERRCFSLADEHVYVDHASGSKSDRERYRAMLGGGAQAALRRAAGEPPDADEPPVGAAATSAEREGRGRTRPVRNLTDSVPLLGRMA